MAHEAVMLADLMHQRGLGSDIKQFLDAGPRYAFQQICMPSAGARVQKLYVISDSTLKLRARRRAAEHMDQKSRYAHCSHQDDKQNSTLLEAQLWKDFKE